MTDTQLLREKIDKSGYKLRFIAAKLGITYPGFLKKINNETEFKASEIQILYDLLNMDGAERDAIFFAVNVDKTSTYKGADTMKKVLKACIDQILEFDSPEEATAFVDGLRQRKQRFNVSSREEVNGKLRIRIQRAYNGNDLLTN